MDIDHRIRFFIVRLMAPLVVIAAPLILWRERRVRKWADRRLVGQLNGMRELVRVAVREDNPNYLRDLRLAVARYRGAMRRTG